MLMRFHKAYHYHCKLKNWINMVNYTVLLVIYYYYYYLE